MYHHKVSRGIHLLFFYSQYQMLSKPGIKTLIKTKHAQSSADFMLYALFILERITEL